MKLLNLLAPEHIKGRRKFIVAMASLTMSFVLALTGNVEGGQWVTAIGLILGLFGAANVGEYVAKNGHGGDG